MIQTIRKAWGIPELRKKIIFTLLMLLIFRIGNAITVPFVDVKLLGAYLESQSTTILGLYNVMSGGAFAQATLFALGVQPYINSSIIIQLLLQSISVDIRNSNRIADPEDQQDEECKDDLLPQFGDSPGLANRIDHVTSPLPFHQLPR